MIASFFVFGKNSMKEETIVKIPQSNVNVHHRSFGIYFPSLDVFPISCKHSCIVLLVEFSFSDISCLDRLVLPQLNSLQLRYRTALDGRTLLREKDEKRSFEIFKTTANTFSRLKHVCGIHRIDVLAAYVIVLLFLNVYNTECCK